jgi:putative phosphoribosyl transferase
MLFQDRRDAGRLLAKKLTEYGNRRDEVARALNAPLDIFLVRKLGLPGYEELAIGAIASGGVRVINQSVLGRYHVSEQMIDEIATRELEELERRERAYRGARPPTDVGGRTAILIDDGLATGASMRAAVVALRQRSPARVVVAVPIAPPDTCRAFEELVDAIVCAMTPEPFLAVGQWYEDFTQTTDEEVRRLLSRAAASFERAGKENRERREKISEVT